MPKRLLIVFVILVALGIVATLPARLVLPSATTGFQFQNIEGTIWSGQAQLRLPQQAPLPMTWQWSGGFIWHWSVDSADLSLDGQWRISDRHSVSKVSGQLDVDYLDIAQWLVVIWPVGQIDVAIETIRWQAPDWLEIQGRLVWGSAAIEGLVNESLGDIEVVMVPSASSPGFTEFVIASSASPALSVSGEALTNGDRYEVRLVLTPDENRRELLRYLSVLGQRGDGAITLTRSGQWGIFND